MRCNPKNKKIGACVCVLLNTLVPGIGYLPVHEVRTSHTINLLLREVRLEGGLPLTRQICLLPVADPRFAVT